MCPGALDGRLHRAASERAKAARKIGLRRCARLAIPAALWQRLNAETMLVNGEFATFAEHDQIVSVAMVLKTSECLHPMFDVHKQNAPIGKSRKSHYRRRLDLAH